MADARTRVIVVEDDPLLRDELRERLAAAGDLEVVAAVGTAAEARAIAGDYQIAIVDLGLPDGRGADLIRELRAARPGLDVMAHTVHEDRATVFDAITAGAASYVLKGCGGDELVRAVRELCEGGSPMSPRIARQVIEAFARQGQVADHYALSARERQVLARLEDGLTYKEVAAELVVSTHTVHTHIKRIYDKLHATSKADALTKAKLRGILR